MTKSLPELGRFAEPALLILVSLSDGPKHGYAIMADVEAGTGRPLGPGTLYAALARLEERGLIEALPPVERRRPYRLTGVGATVLSEQLERLSEFARVGLRRLGQAPRGPRARAAPSRLPASLARSIWRRVRRDPRRATARPIRRRRRPAERPRCSPPPPRPRRRL